MSKRRRIALRIVADGYDRIAERYARWVAEELVDDVRARYAAVLLDGLPAGARVLELGCGGGGPTTRRLAERFVLTGVDLSARQIELARRHVPTATFVHADMTALGFAPESFDGVAAFYALTHLPQGDLPRLLRGVATWLRPGGLLVASMGAWLDPGTVEEDWLGAPLVLQRLPAPGEPALHRGGRHTAPERSAGDHPGGRAPDHVLVGRRHHAGPTRVKATAGATRLARPRRAAGWDSRHRPLADESFELPQPGLRPGLVHRSTSPDTRRGV